MNLLLLRITGSPDHSHASAGSPPNRFQNSDRTLRFGTSAFGVSSTRSTPVWARRTCAYRLRSACRGGLRGGFLWLAAEMRPEHVAGVAAREGCVRDRHAKKTAERLPAVGDVEDKEPVGGDDLADAGVVRAVAGDRAVAVGEVAEGFLDQTGLRHFEDFQQMWRQWDRVQQGEELADGAVEACPPVVFRTFGVDHLRIGKGNGGILPDRRAGPVDLRSVAGVDLGPVDVLTGEDRLPVGELFWMGHHFGHVMD